LALTALVGLGFEGALRSPELVYLKTSRDTWHTHICIKSTQQSKNVVLYLLSVQLALLMVVELRLGLEVLAANVTPPQVGLLVLLPFALSSSL